jgi:hypothetical protein
MNIEFTVPLPDLMRAQEIYNVEYAFTVKKVMLLLLFLLPSFLCLSITQDLLTHSLSSKILSLSPST